MKYHLFRPGSSGIERGGAHNFCSTILNRTRKNPLPKLPPPKKGNKKIFYLGGGGGGDERKFFKKRTFWFYPYFLDILITHFYRIRERGGSFENRRRNIDIIHHFKGNCLEIPIYFKFFKNILISRIYEEILAK